MCSLIQMKKGGSIPTLPLTKINLVVSKFICTFVKQNKIDMEQLLNHTHTRFMVPTRFEDYNQTVTQSIQETHQIFGDHEYDLPSIDISGIRFHEDQLSLVDEDMYFAPIRMFMVISLLTIYYVVIHMEGEIEEDDMDGMVEIEFSVYTENRVNIKRQFKFLS